MIKYDLVTSLTKQAEKIKDVYKEIGLGGINTELKNQLYSLVKEEEAIYNLIPLEEYPSYLDYFLEFLERDPYDYVSFITLTDDFQPKIRIIWKFLYLESKASMFCDTNIVAEEYRWEYVYENERFNNLLLFYATFLKKYEKYELDFNVSFMSVLYHSPYAEAIYFKNNIYYDKEWLFKFSGFSNVYSELDKDFIAEIQMFCSDLLAVTMDEDKDLYEEEIIEQEDNQDVIDSHGVVSLLQDKNEDDKKEESEEEFDYFEKDEQYAGFYFLEEPFTKIGIIMYLTSLYYSISDKKVAMDLLNSYKTVTLDKNQKEIFDEISFLVNNSDVLKKEIIKKQ